MEKGTLTDLFCEQCSLQFDKKCEFNVHLSIAHKGKNPEKDSQEANGSEKPSITELNGYFKCDTCNFGFVTKKGLKWHVFSTHDGKKSLKSNPCTLLVLIDFCPV